MSDELSQTEREELEQLRKEKELQKKSGGLYMKVSQKGALSLYGLGRFPVTLYKEQWEKVLALHDQIKQFMVDNNDELKTKS